MPERTAAIVGETGSVEETVRVGPVSLRRARLWNDADALAAVFAKAGWEAAPVHPLTQSAPVPDLWVLSDAPRDALLASGLHQQIRTTTGEGAHLLMLGGALSFGGQQGMGGWHDDPLLPVTSEGDDTCELPDGARLDGDVACATLFYGHNRVRPRHGARVRATLAGHPAVVTSGDGRAVALATDLMPHWGPGASGGDDLAALLSALLPGGTL